jgi:acetamidase/formamidase
LPTLRRAVGDRWWALQQHARYPPPPFLITLTDIARTCVARTHAQITPHIKGGHEVTIPTEVAGAEVGDAVAIRIKSISITSLATASGNDFWVDGKYMGDPYCAKYHTEEKKFYPETYVDGIGEDAVKYKSTKESATPFKFANGYTIAFDRQHKVGVTVNKQSAEKIAKRAKHYAALPQGSTQHSILTFAPSHLVAVATRVRAFMGQLGSCPAVALPDSHNAGDFGAYLVGAPHPQAITQEQLVHRTDGHMDIDHVRAGSILIVPCKVNMYLCVCVCVCVHARARACVYALCVCVCVCTYKYAHVRTHTHAHTQCTYTNTICMRYVCDIYAVCMRYVCGMYAVCMRYVCGMYAV